MIFSKELIEIVSDDLIDAKDELYLCLRSILEIFGAQEPSCHHLHFRCAEDMLEQINGVFCSCKMSIHRCLSLVFRPGSIPVSNHRKVFRVYHMDCFR